MKYVLTVLFIIGFFLSPIPKKSNKVISNKSRCLVYSDTKLSDKYLVNRLQYAIVLERAYGIPVSVQIAVDLMESGINKKSKFHNDSWITCKCNYSKKARKAHINGDRCFLAYDGGAGKWYWFKKYKSLAENWEDKCRVISNYKWFKPNQTFEYYSKRLQGTYAESKKYTKSLNAVNSCYLETMKYDILYQ